MFPVDIEKYPALNKGQFSHIIILTKSKWNKPIDQNINNSSLRDMVDNL